MMLNMSDQILQQLVPTVMVPRYEDLAPLEKNGHRYLIAEDGLYIEVRRPWLHCIWPVPEADGLTLPYGPIKEVGNTLGFDWTRASELIADFQEIAADELPDECAGAIIWNEPSGTLRLQICRAIEASPVRVKYHRPDLRATEHIVIDIHSHAFGSAGFSEQDDSDDSGEVKFAAVVGRVNRAIPEIAMRLCLPGDVFIHDYEWVEE